MKAKNLRDTSHTSQNSNGSTGPGQQSFLKNQLSNHPNIRGNYQQMLPPQFQQSSSLHLRFGSQGNNQILNTTGNESTEHQKMNWLLINDQICHGSWILEALGLSSIKVI